MARIAVLALAALLAACGGGSDVGSQNDLPPLAEATAEGLGAGDGGVFTARAGSDVLITGKNSDGLDDPLLEFQWRQLSGTPVVLFERTSNSRVFTAPAVEETLEFELTVIDSGGVSATDTVAVRVTPVLDANEFLKDPSVDREFYVFVSPEGAGSEVAATLPYELTITPVVLWTDRGGAARSQALEPILAAAGQIDAGFRIPTDPVDLAQDHFSVGVPLLDRDEVNAFFQGSNRPGRLELEAVRDARMELIVELDAVIAADLGVFLARRDGTGFQALDGGSVLAGAATPAPPGGAILAGRNASVVVDLEKLRQELGIESFRSAANYYSCIDPDGRAGTLAGWLAHAGFDGGNDEAHARYVNNFDLGFGRDMFVRRDDDGNVFSYVVNYPSLEKLLRGQDEFATVAMEYSAAPEGTCDAPSFSDTRKIVKFYAYVPDTVTGEMVRAESMNFDGRGERFLPGVCTACHDGSIDRIAALNVAELAAIDAQNADLSASFLPWDLDALLYTDAADPAFVDPSFTRDEFSPDTIAAWSREAQQDSFRAMNEAVLGTYVDKRRRYEEPLRLIHGWYGNEAALPQRLEDDPATETDETDDVDLQSPLEQLDAESLTTLPAAAFDGSYVQEGWIGREALYQEVFARHCRMCHAQQDNLEKNFDSYDELVSAEVLRPYVFERGVMPAARLTLDRFWVDFDGDGTSAAERLKDHLNTFEGAGIPLDQVPGRPIAVANASPLEVGAVDAAGDLVPTVIGLDAGDSLFADEFFWRVSTDSACAAMPRLVGETSPQATFVADASPCVYTVNLQAASGLFSSEHAMEIVTDRTPEAVDFAAPLAGYTPGDAFLDIDVLAQVPDALDGDGGLHLIVNDPAPPFELAVNDNVVHTSPGIARISFPALAGSSEFFQYKVEDVNGSVSPGIGLVNVSVPPIRPGMLNPMDITATSFTLNWGVPAGFVADSYSVLRDGPLLDGTFELVGTTAALSFLDSPLASGATYVYRITAHLDGEQSSPSDDLSVTTAVGIPQALAVDDATTSDISLSWSPGAGSAPDFYAIYRNGGLIDTTTDPFYTDAGGLEQNTIYDYQVSQVIGSIESELSSTLSTATDTAPPLNLSVARIAGSTTSLSVQWDPPSGGGVPVSYRVLQNGVTEVASTSATTFTDTGLTPNTLYSYQVEANGINGASDSAGSGQVRTHASFAVNIAPRRTSGDGFSQSCSGCHSAAGWENNVRNNTPGCLTNDGSLEDCDSAMDGITITQGMRDLLLFWSGGGKLD